MAAWVAGVKPMQTAQQVAAIGLLMEQELVETNISARLNTAPIPALMSWYHLLTINNSFYVRVPSALMVTNVQLHAVMVHVAEVRARIHAVIGSKHGIHRRTCATMQVALLMITALMEWIVLLANVTYQALTPTVFSGFGSYLVSLEEACSYGRSLP